MRMQLVPEKTISTLAIAFTVLILVACSSDGPTDRNFSIEFANGEPVGGVERFTANQGDTINIDLSTDESATFHIHGYDLEFEVEAGSKDSIELLADATGRFAIEIEELEQDVAFLEIRP
ncbi:MAG: hypothetical protein OTJ98_08995 [Dehalococcoidia bacterium]|nr:hypothetical protein [Dehalococcoidia bacterium]